MQKKASLFFDSAWVLSKREDSVLPVEAFVEAIEGIFEVNVLSTSLTECDIVIKDEGISDDEINDKVLDILIDKFALTENDDFVEYSLSDYETDEGESVGCTEIVTDEADFTADAVPNEAENEKVAAVMKKIDALIGADEFKVLAHECVKVAPGLIRHNTEEAFTNRCYIFSINDGDGLSTYLELYAELLDALELFKFSAGITDGMCVKEQKIPYNQSLANLGISSSEDEFHFTEKGKLVCYDISEFMSKLGDNQFRDIMSEIENHIGEGIVIFRVPFVEKEILKSLKAAIGDRLFVREISFIPFDADELIKCAEMSLESRGYTMENDAWDVFNARINEEKNDGKFYGFNTVNKVILEMLYRKQLDNSANGVDDTVIKKSEIIGLAATYTDGKTGLDLLDDFIGMKEIKHRVEELIAQIETTKRNKNLGHPCFHMRFVGNPGTGKTTVARVIGQILKEKGILRNGNFFEYFARDLCGKYIGETAPKTAAICRDAYGSVLFLDEAYSLYRQGDSGNDFGREAVETLIAEMENHRKDFVVIMAGYTDEMDHLMKANPGLESRMPYIIEFPNYTRDQLFEIFMMMTKKNFTWQEGFEEAVKEYFTTLPEDVVTAKEFSNARFVRNLFERTWGKAVMRAQFNKEDPSVLIKEDFTQASSEKEFKKIMEKKNRTLGFN